MFGSPDAYNSTPADTTEQSQLKDVSTDLPPTTPVLTPIIIQGRIFVNVFEQF